MANQFAATQGTINIDSHVDLLNKAIDVVWMRRNEFMGVLGRFFDKQTKQSGLTHIISSVGSTLPLPVENDDQEALPYFSPAPGFDKTFVLVRYRSGIRVTRTMLKADRFSRVAQMATGQLKSGFRKDEYLRAALFNNAFTGDDSADSKDMCDDSRPQENPEAGTWDNKGTGALSGANLHALRLLARQMTDDQGDPDPVMPKTLLIPEDLEQTANELIGATLKPATALNDPNVLLPGIEVVVSPYLSSATQYFLIGDREGEDKGLHEIVLEDWVIRDNTPANADIVLDKMVAATKTIGQTVTRNVMGSTGS